MLSQGGSVRTELNCRTFSWCMKQSIACWRYENHLSHCPQLIWVQNSIEDQNFSPDQPHNIISTSNIYTARMLSSSSNFFSSLISIPLTSHSSNLGPFNNLFCFLMVIFLMAEFCYNFEFCDAIVS